MVNSIAKKWRGTVIGLALLFASCAFASDSLDDVNYVLIENHSQPEKSRLLIFNDGHTRPTGNPSRERTVRDEIQAPMIMLRAASSRHRVRGLTLLAGFDDVVILRAAMDMLDDESAAVRGEAINLAMNHPLADHELIAAKGLADSSRRVREVTADLFDELQQD